MCECASVCLSMHSCSVWLAMCMGRRPICVGLSMGLMRENGVWMRVCARVQTPKPCQRVMREWESVFGKQREGLGHVRWNHCLCMLLHDEGNAPLPLFLPWSFVLDVFPGNAAVVSTFPKSHSHRLPLPSPKAGWEKICHLHHCGILALYGLSKSGSAEREGFETEQGKGLEMRVESPV